MTKPATRAALLAAGLAICSYYGLQELRATGGAPGLPLDDSFIHLRFAQSLAEGQGLAYQGGAWVSGSTGPLWTALLALGFLLPVDPIWWAKALGVAAYLATIPVFLALLRAYGVAAPLAVAATALLLLTDWLAWSALSGMEISLFVLLSTCGLLLHERELRRDGGATPGFALPVLALAALARPEGLLLLLLAIVERAFEAWRGPRGGFSTRGAWWALATGVAASAIVLAPAWAFSWIAGGVPVPSTLGAKIGGVHKLVPALRDFWRAGEVLFRPQPWAFFFAGAGTVRLLVARSGPPESGGARLLPALWLLALPAAYSMLAPPGQPAPLGNFGRYVFPLFPCLVLLGALGVSAAWQEIARSPARRPRLRGVAALLAAIAIAAPSVLALHRGAGRFALNVANVEDSDVAAGRWIAERLPPMALLAVQDIGAIAYHAPNPVLDLVGIVEPEAAHAIRSGGLPGLMDLVRRRRAEYLVVFPVSYGGSEHLARLLPGMVELRRFPVRQNITMAGPELVVYRLPPGADSLSP
jgi:hypothetical protein